MANTPPKTAPPKTAPQSAPKTPPAASQASQRTILIVEDAAAVQQLLIAILAGEFRVVAAGDGESALDLARAEPPDLVLLDIDLPGISGFEVCRRLKANSATEHVPIIFLTGRDEASDRQAGLAAGAVDYLTKPIRPMVLRDRVRQVLR